jgi:hypothetical protein
VVEIHLWTKLWKQDPKLSNWESVMDKNWWLWWLPVSPKLDRKLNLEFEFNEKTKRTSREKSREKLISTNKAEVFFKPTEAHFDINI